MFRMAPTNTSLSRINLNDWMEDFFSPVHGFKMDVQKTDDAYTIQADLPGVKKDQLTIAYEDDRLTIEVNAKEETQEENTHYVHKERRQVNMKRSLYLADIDDKNIKARLEDGILTIHVPKVAPVDTRVLIDVE